MAKKLTDQERFACMAGSMKVIRDHQQAVVEKRAPAGPHCRFEIEVQEIDRDKIRARGA